MQKSRIVSWIIMFAILTINVGISQDSTMTDSLLANQNTIIKNQETMMSEVVYEDPLHGKRFGVEFNPVSFLFSTASDEGFLLSGSISSFTASDKAEVAFPFYIVHGSDRYKQYTVGSHYRYFLGKHRKGLYISSGIRLTHIEGEKRSYWYSYETDDGLVSDDKIGLTFGIGYRKYGYNGWYWGMSLFGGRYLESKDLGLSGAWLSDGKLILDMELLKIGKMF